MDQQTWHTLNEFKQLIEETQRVLRGVALPSQLFTQMEPLIARWKQTDDDFAALLENLCGEAWSMSEDHFKAMCQQVDQHLSQQVASINEQIGRRGR